MGNHRFGRDTAASGAGAVRSWRASMALFACALALALVACLIPATKAAAYFSFGTVGVSLGSSYASLQPGASTSVSVSISPASSDQTLGCGMAKCPQVCDTDESVAAGYSCFDANGQCTCMGRQYSTYYPSAYASSSNSGVASAYLSGSTLVITANGAGSATITVGASLRQYTDGAASIQVDVSAPPAPDTGGTDSGGSTGGSSTSAPESPSSAPDSSAPSSTPNAVGIPQAATPLESRDDGANEQVLETEGGKVILAECNGYLDAPATLAKIVGTDDQVVFWSGTSSERPDYSWTFTGNKLADDAATRPFDPTITVSKLGTGNVSNVMRQAKDGIVLEFAQTGDLPGEAVVYVNVDAAYGDGSTVDVYDFDEQRCAFEQAAADTPVEAGYASFSLTSAPPARALSTDNLASYELEETNTPGAVSVSKQDNIADERANGWIVPAAVGIVAVAILAIIAVVLVRRRKAAATIGEPVTGEAEVTPEEGKAPADADE